MPNPLFHWELMVEDVEQAAEFYSKVFDWEIDKEQRPHYPLIKTGGTPGGAFLEKPKQIENSSFNAYFYVDDVEETLARAMVSGGKVVTPKMVIPGVGYWGAFSDPEGIVIGVMQME